MTKNRKNLIGKLAKIKKYLLARKNGKQVDRYTEKMKQKMPKNQEKETCKKCRKIARKNDRI